MRKTVLFAVLSLVLLATSCGSYKRLGYLQDLETGRDYAAADKPDPHIYKNDELRIVVTCSSPQLAAPFNVVTGTVSYDTASGAENISANSTLERGFVVDEHGDINFPVLGTIHVEGLTPEELKLKIEGMIKDRNYIKDPIVMVDFINFQITMLGEVKAGNYIVRSGGINILEALAQAGDLTPDAVRDDIWVIRTTGNTRKVYSVNLKSKSLYDSPAFYLQQNDLIYVKPRDNKIDASTATVLNWSNFAMSIISLVSNTLMWLLIYGII